MTISASALTVGGSSTDTSSYATASITPTANRLVLVLVTNFRSLGASTPTLTGNGLTWVQVATVAYAAGGDRATVFRAMGAAPTTGAITIAFGGVTQLACAWSVIEFGGVDTGGTNGSAAVVQSATNSVAAGTSLGVTLAAFGSANNGAYAGFGTSQSTSAITPDGGWTEVHDQGLSGDQGRIETQWRVDPDTSAAASWGLSADAGGVALEIKAFVGPQTYQGSATMAGVGALTASGTRKVSGAALMAGVGAMAATPTFRHGGRAELAGSGALAATPRYIAAIAVLVPGAPERQTSDELADTISAEVL